MDRIRKALDLARSERARILMDADDSLRGRSIAESRIEAVISPIAGSVLKPIVSPQRIDLGSTSVELEHLISSALASIVPSGATSTPPTPTTKRTVSMSMSGTPAAAHAPAPVVAPVVEEMPSPERAAPLARSVVASPPSSNTPAAVIELARFVAPSARAPFSAPSPVTTPAPPSAEMIEAKVPPLNQAMASSSPTMPPPSAAAVKIQHSQAVKLTPSPQPFRGVVEYTKTRSYAPAPDRLEAKRIIDPRRVEPVASAFRMLRTQVLQLMEERGWRSLAVLSPNSEDGKTTIAANLAVSLAYDHRHTVLLVDCDLKHPGIAEAFGITPEFGLDDVLTARASVDQCLYHPEGFDRLVILPARAALANSSEALSSTRARELVSELKTRYPERIVLFDLPPILGTDDALAFLPLADCALMVAAERATKREDLLRSMELAKRIPIVGTVLNRSAAVSRPYG